jgi:hypothetical protein
MPHPDLNSHTSRYSSSTTDADRISDWLGSIAGPTALISSPAKGQVILPASPAQGVLFDGSLSQPLVGTQLVGWDWEVVGRTAEGKPFQTSFTGKARQVLLPSGTYSVTLTVQAVQLKTGDVTAGSDYVAAFTVVQQHGSGGNGGSSSGGSSGSSHASGTRQGALQVDWQQQQQQQLLLNPSANSDVSAAAAAPTSNQFASWSSSSTSTSSSSNSPSPSAPTAYPDPPPYLIDGTGNPFGWAFGSVLAAANSVSKEMQLQQQLQQQEEQHKQQELERLRLLLFPSPPPPPSPVLSPPAPPPAPPAPPPPPSPPPPPPQPEPLLHEPADTAAGKNKGSTRGKKGLI